MKEAQNCRVSRKNLQQTAKSNVCVQKKMAQKVSNDLPRCARENGNFSLSTRRCARISGGKTRARFARHRKETLEVAENLSGRNL